MSNCIKFPLRASGVEMKGGGAVDDRNARAGRNETVTSGSGDETPAIPSHAMQRHLAVRNGCRWWHYDARW